MPEIHQASVSKRQIETHPENREDHNNNAEVDKVITKHIIGEYLYLFPKFRMVVQEEKATRIQKQWHL